MSESGKKLSSLVLTQYNDFEKVYLPTFSELLLYDGIVERTSLACLILIRTCKQSIFSLHFVVEGTEVLRL